MFLNNKSVKLLVEMKNDLEEKIYIQKWNIKSYKDYCSSNELSNNIKLLEEVNKKLDKVRKSEKDLDVIYGVLN